MCIETNTLRNGGTKLKQAIWQSVQPLKRVVLPLQSQWNLRTTDTTRSLTSSSVQPLTPMRASRELLCNHCTIPQLHGANANYIPISV